MTQIHQLLFILLSLRFVYGQYVPEDDYDLYDSNEDEDDGGLGEEYEELHSPQIRPHFTTRPQHFKIPIGHSARLPCRVQNLGNMVTMWKLVNGSADHLSPSYLTTGKQKLTSDPNIRLEEIRHHGSTLIIDQMSPDSVGYYVCEVSSSPPASLRHELSILSPPTATILKEERTYKIDAGRELALVCTGTGDPKPVIKWKRERKRLPDGRNEIEASQMVFQNVTRKHSGTYICEASNGPGQTAIDSVVIDVLHAPDILGEPTYVEKADGIQMELVCIVHASPAATVSWYRNDQPIRAQQGRVRASRIGRKHLLTVDQLTAASDAGTYECRASNPKGHSSQSFQVLAELQNVIG